MGEAVIDLARYSKCLDRKLFSVELAKSQFPEALIDFYITASPLVGSERRNTQKASHKPHAKGQLVGHNTLVQSTRNSASKSFNDSRFDQAKRQSQLKGHELSSEGGDDANKFVSDSGDPQARNSVSSNMEIEPLPYNSNGRIRTEE